VIATECTGKAVPPTAADPIGNIPGEMKTMLEDADGPDVISDTAFPNRVSTPLVAVAKREKPKPSKAIAWK